MHCLGIIPANAYTYPGLVDGECNGVDLQYLGLIPIGMQKAVQDFMQELHENKVAQKEIMAGWDRLKATALIKC